MAKRIYQNPEAGKALITAISTGCKTPKLEVKFCNLIKPFYFPNSPKIPRYSVTCMLDPENHIDFLNVIQTIEKNEGVETIIKNDMCKKDKITVTTGLLNLKFQTKDLVPVFIPNEADPTIFDPIDLEDELAKGEMIIVEYDILRYTKKNTLQTEHGISFKPTKIIYFPSDVKKEKNGDS